MMSGTAVLSMMWSQCFQVTVVVLLVAPLAHFLSRSNPRLACALWLVVLLKCLTPPVMSSPSSLFGWLETPRFEQVDSIADQTPYTEVLKESNAFSEASVLVGDHDRIQEPVAAIEQELAGPISFASPSNQSSGENFETGQIAAITSGNIPIENTDWNRQHMVLLVFALLGTTVLFLATLLRLVSCLRAIGINQSGRFAVVTEILNELLAVQNKSFFGIKRVRVIVTKAPLGPAVFGWIRPTILVPVRLVQRCSRAELKPIIAHELAHLQRGDIWFGSLQFIVQCLWWFHPLVWLANRMANTATERSCDEAVVGRFKISPGDYARSLLTVMEYKQSLRALPAFPGVRFFQITSKRLEKIMKMRQGSHSLMSWWSKLFIVCVSASILPGARWATAVQDPTGTGTPISPNSDNTTTRSEARQYLVGKLLEKLKADCPQTADLQAEFLRQLQVRVDCLMPYSHDDLPQDATGGRQIASNIDRNLLSPVEFHWDGNTTLCADQPLEMHQQIEAALEQMNQYGFKQAAVNITFIQCSRALVQQEFLKWQPILPNKINVDTEVKELRNYEYMNPQFATAKKASNVDVINRLPAAELYRAIISPTELNEFYKWLAADQSAIVQGSWQPSLLAGSELHVDCGGHLPIVLNQLEKNYLQLMWEGISFGTVIRGANGDSFFADFSIEDCRFAGSRTFTFAQNNIAREVTLPTIANTKAEFALKSNTGDLLAIAGWPIPGDNSQTMMILVEIEPEPKENIQIGRRTGMVSHFLTMAHIERLKKRDLDATSITPTSIYVGDLVPVRCRFVLGEPNIPDIDYKYRSDDFERIAQITKLAVAPESWAPEGIGTLVYYPAGTSFVVSNTPQVVDELRDALQLERFNQSRRAVIDVLPFCLDRKAMSELLPPGFDFAKNKLTANESFLLNKSIKAILDEKSTDVSHRITSVLGQTCVIPSSMISKRAMRESKWLVGTTPGSGDLESCTLSSSEETTEESPMVSPQSFELKNGESMLVDLTKLLVDNPERGVPVEGADKVFRSIGPEKSMLALLTVNLSHDKKLFGELRKQAIVWPRHPNPPTPSANDE